MIDKPERIPNPGSPEAVELGCLCPVLDNHHGQGIPKGEDDVVFWINSECPIHSK